MKTVFDASFRYKPSFDTDVRKTFERARREQQARVRRVSKGSDASGNSNVLHLEQRAQEA